MVIHYAASPETVACGRPGAALASSQDLTEVSCKLCKRTAEKEAAEPVRRAPTLAELRAAAKAAKAAAVVVEAVKPRVTLTPRQEWKQRLEQMPGRNRLPRGF